MWLLTKTGRINVTDQLAEAIASLDIDKVADLLSEKGEYWIKDEKNEVIITGKSTFLNWLNDCFSKFLSTNRHRRKLKYNIVKCLHCMTGNPIIIYENERFPVFIHNPWRKEKLGFMVEIADSHVTRIILCLLILKSEDPFIYELKKLKA